MEIIALIFVLVMIAVAYIAFRILKKTLKLALRAIIVIVILAVAVLGGLALWNMGFLSGDQPASSETK